MQGFLKEVGNQVKVTKMVALRLGSCRGFGNKLRASQDQVPGSRWTEMELGPLEGKLKLERKLNRIPMVKRKLV